MQALPNFVANRAEIELLIVELDLTTEPVTRSAPILTLDRDEIIAEIQKERQQQLLQMYHKYSTRSRRPTSLKDFCALDSACTGSLFE